MPSFPSFENIDLTNIHLTDEWNIHPFLDSKLSLSLINSIEKVGILQPPVVQKHLDTFRLISGKSRIHAFKTLYPHDHALPCRVIAEDTPPEQILSHIIEEKLLSGMLTPMEKAFFIEKCLKHIDIKRTTESFLPTLCEKPQPHTIKKFQRLLKLEPEIQISVHNGEIDKKTAYELLNLTQKDRLALHTLFMDLKLGGGKQKRLLSLSKDLAFREDISITELFVKSNLREILTHSEMNTPQKVTVLLATMQKLLFPQSEAAEKEFKETIKKMRLPSSCTVSHGQSFETDEAFVTIRFKNIFKIQSLLPQIEALAKS